MNLKAFYDSIRATLFKGALSSKQVEGIEAMLTEYNRQCINDLRKLAYILATAYHETAKTMQPIAEYGKGVGKDYGKKLTMSRQPYTSPNHIFYGRGHTQNTWYENYYNLTVAARAQGKNWDFLNNPDLLLQMEPSIWATFYAMKSGLYTGKSLAMYFTKDKTDALNARKIVNGLDKAALIKTYYERFYGALILQ